LLNDFCADPILRLPNETLVLLLADFALAIIFYFGLYNPCLTSDWIIANTAS
jgi:hypothetical protein